MYLRAPSLIAGGLVAYSAHNANRVVRLESLPPRRYGFFGPRDDPADKQQDCQCPPQEAASPFVYEALTRGTRSRIKREQALREFLEANATKIRGQISHLRSQIPRAVAGKQTEEEKQKRKDLLNFVAYKEREIQDEVELQAQVRCIAEIVCPKIYRFSCSDSLTAWMNLVLEESIWKSMDASGGQTVQSKQLQTFLRNGQLSKSAQAQVGWL